MELKNVLNVEVEFQWSYKGVQGLLRQNDEFLLQNEHYGFQTLMNQINIWLV